MRIDKLIKVFADTQEFCKNDTNFQMAMKFHRVMPELKDRYYMPNRRASDFRKLKLSALYIEYENFELHMKKVKHIMHIAAFNRIDLLIYGAFRNYPEVAAMAWQETLKDYRRKFDYIVLAIYFRKYEIINCSSTQSR